MTDVELALAKKLYDVFVMLGSSDAFLDSSTAQKLRTWSPTQFRARAVEEWEELHGCVDGTHRHSDDFAADFLMESSQVFYWLACAAITERKDFDGFIRDSFYAAEVGRIATLYAEAGIPFTTMFRKELEACKEKGYIS